MDGEGNKDPVSRKRPGCPQPQGRKASVTRWSVSLAWRDGTLQEVECGPHLRWQMDFTWKGSEGWSVGKDWRKVGVGSL